MTSRVHRNRRKGTVAVLSAFLVVVIFSALAFSIDVGYLLVTQTQLQRTADSAAIAAAWELIDLDAPSGFGDAEVTEQNARTLANEFAGYNGVLTETPQFSNQDIQVGYIANPTDPSSSIDLSSAMPPNAVRVVVRRDDQQNGEVPLFFAPVLGINSAELNAEATAALLNNFGGFRTPSAGNLDILPFALDIETWNAMLAGIGTDDWTWDAELEEVQSGADGILEVNLFPQGTGSPGNRGTIDIGSDNNSTAVIARQIVDGITEQDLSYHGGTLEFDEYGELPLNGDTGISAGVKDELQSIKGKPRIIPIFNQVSGNGNNAQYTIVRFAGIRIMEVKLTGKMTGKRVIVQPANIVAKGGVPSTASEQTSDFVYSPVWLAR